MAPFFMPGVLIGSRSLKLTGGAYNRADELFIFIELLSCWLNFPGNQIYKAAGVRSDLDRAAA